MSQSHEFTNRLSKEKSPYLLQHAHNPVNWYPWGVEAFEAAKHEDKPILLSIGYATCHWCHVMEKECFEDVEIAKLLNENFINIKVDREEMPEVDSLYMEFAQSMMAGAAGWPLNVILTPELQPFFAATYMPPRASHGLTGLVDLIARIKEVWSGEEREHVMDQAEHIVQAFSTGVHLIGDDIPEKELIQDSAELLLKMADPVYGGIKGVPKFPIGYQWNFLLHYASMMDEGRSLFLAERTLDMMHRGGIFDHLGGGFSRYSTDESWLVPHFEKMLYDNALISYSYLEAWQVTHRPFYRTVCSDVLHYIQRDMTHSEGGFFSAEDADSEGHEGYFYTWTIDEIQNILGAKESDLFCQYYGITSKGNFHDRNILHTPTLLEEFAGKRGRNVAELEELFSKQRNVLWRVREARVRPFKDDKILASWNGLTIFSMAEAGAALEDKTFTKSAVESARFVKEHMWKDGHLLRRWREGEALLSGSLEDYAFLARGLLSLFETGQGTEWLQWAIELADVLREEYKSENGAFYQTDGKDSSIILRKCQYADGAEPSGNAIQCENLLRLYQLTYEKKYLEQAEDILKAVHKYIENYAPGYSYHLLNLIRYYDAYAVTAVIALNEKEESREEIKKLLYQSYSPHRAVIWRRNGDRALLEAIPFVEKQGPIDGKTTLYLCEKGGVCSKPLTDLKEMADAISKL